jgi:hypothetical protein
LKIAAIIPHYRIYAKVLIVYRRHFIENWALDNIIHNIIFVPPPSYDFIPKLFDLLKVVLSTPFDTNFIPPEVINEPPTKNKLTPKLSP